MSKLEQLIQELCPNGVEYKRLGEIVEYQRGKSITKKNVIEGDIPVISGGQQPAYYHNESNREGKTITIAGSGAYAGYIMYWEKPIFVSDAFSLKGNEININTKYIYYYLKKIQEKIYSLRKGAGISHVYFKDMQDFLVPVPPLEVQCEIVRILDKFTLLTAELTAELTARRKQYEYYFIKILNENSYKKIKLGDIGQVKMCKRILKVQTNNKCGIPFYKIGTFGKEADTFIDNETFEEYKSKYSYPRKGDVLISCSGTIGRTVIFDGKPAYFQDSNIVWLEHDSSKVLNDYLFYYYKTTPWVIPTGGTIARLYNDNILKTEISIPTIEKQKEIVSKLKYFDKLCNDITNGLPAEIELRQKQYEYYRDKLLTFKEKNNE